MLKLIPFLITAGAALGQQPLTLKEAVQQALQAHPSQDIAAASVREAQARVEQARASFLPRATYTEFFQTSNQPVFAFGTLLNQRRFTSGDFALDALNNPGFVNNFQSQISAEQIAWDFGTWNHGL